MVHKPLSHSNWLTFHQVKKMKSFSLVGGLLHGISIIIAYYHHQALRNIWSQSKSLRAWGWIDRRPSLLRVQPSVKYNSKTPSLVPISTSAPNLITLTTHPLGPDWPAWGWFLSRLIMLLTFFFFFFLVCHLNLGGPLLAIENPVHRQPLNESRQNLLALWERQLLHNELI